MVSSSARRLSVRDLNASGKRVLVRCDLNVPLAHGAVADGTRIRASLPTIRHLTEAGARVILMSHLGRPKGRVVPDLSLAPVAGELSRELGMPVAMAPDCVGPEVMRLAAELGDGEVLLLENLRFHAEETANEESFAKGLAALADLFVSDAFGTAHRAHASTAGAAAHFEQAAAGFLLEKELAFLGGAVTDPERPCV
ncbi:MAG: phosphoglycerate kinase, partial [Gemmatimonadota bacterium]|nr:phosphoglycerate kinase [Gemmatimonadota bacterium]